MRTRCPRCGGAIDDAGEWCSLCFMPVADPGEIGEELARTVDDRAHYRWEPPRRSTAPAPAPVFSRWHAGPSSFGPGGKLLATLLFGGLMFLPGLLATCLALFVYVVRDPYRDDLRPVAFVFFLGVALLVVGGLVLREVWRARRVR